MRGVFCILIVLAALVPARAAEARSLDYDVTIESPGKAVALRFTLQFVAPITSDRPLLEQSRPASGTMQTSRTMRGTVEREQPAVLASAAALDLLFAVGESELLTLPTKRAQSLEPVDPFNLDGMTATLSRTINGRQVSITRDLKPFDPMTGFLLRFLKLVADHTGSKIAAECRAEILRGAEAVAPSK